MQWFRELPPAIIRPIWCARRTRRYYSAGPACLPDHSEVVLCGGGVIGCSVAYHLAKLGCNDVVLLEQGR